MKRTVGAMDASVTNQALARARAGARLYGMVVLTLEGRQISAITWFGGNSAFRHFGLPRILRQAIRSGR